MKNAQSLILLLAALITAHANAHGIWFAQRSGELALIYGEGPEDGAIVPRLAKVKGVAAYDEAGKAVPTKLISTDYLLLVDTQQKPVVITGVLDNGIWTSTADGKEVNQAKNEVPGAKSSGHYYKYAVHLRGDLKAPLGALPEQVLQIVPVDAALPKQKGDSFKVRVLYQGKPLADAAVIADFVNDVDAKPMRTGSDGTITLTVCNQGLNVISASHDSPTDNPVLTDKIGHRATLSFVVAPKGD